jgi:3-oxoacyl-[acyl-carrier protein] reductase
MRFVDKVAVVTGGSQGIGECVARRFGAEGARVAVVASTDIAKAGAVSDAIAAAGGAAKPFACNVANAAEVAALVADVIAAFGRIDILVNSAGVFYPTPLGATDEAMFDRMCDINLKGCFQMCNAVAPHMIARGSGKIVNIGSTAGIVGLPDYIVYTATKAAVLHMTRSLAMALAPHGVNVNAVAPGNTETPMNADIRTQPRYAAARAAIEANTPSPRSFTPPDEIAGGVLFLASDDAQAMHGSVLLMDEGRTAG